MGLFDSLVSTNSGGGLLGQNFDDPRSAAIMALSAGLLQRNLAGGLIGANNAYAQGKQAQQQQAMQQLQMRGMQSDLEAREADRLQRADAIKQAQAIRAAIPSLFRQPGMTGGEAVPQDVGGVPMFSKTMGVTPMQSTPGGFDVQRALQLGMDPETIGKYAGLENIGRQKVARTVEVDDGKGGKATMQIDEWGRPVGAALPGYVAPVQVNQGDRVTFTRPAAGVSLPVGMSLSERDASDRGWAGNAIAEKRLEMDREEKQNAYTFSADMGGYVPKNPGGQFVPLSGAPHGATKLTESEGKNTLYLSQMRDASNTLDKLKKVNPTSVALTDSSFTNWMAGEDSQKVGQARRQWSEAYLRAKTGAAATAGEVDNNIRTFFPVSGDSQSVMEQKALARDQAERDMAIPAGRGAERAVQRNAPSNTVQPPPVGEVRGGYKFKGGDPSLPASWEKM